MRRIAASPWPFASTHSLQDSISRSQPALAVALYAKQSIRSCHRSSVSTQRQNPMAFVRTTSSYSTCAFHR